MTIGIMGAMTEEIEPFLKHFKTYEKISHAQNTYYKASFGRHDIILAYSKIGKVNAALTTTVMIERFKADKIIFTGVAGALGKDLKIGDLLFATKLVQHDVDITAFGHPPGFIPETGDFFCPSDELLDLARKTANKLDIAYKEGILATGDEFVASEDRKKIIVEKFNAIACEMEGASLALVCTSYNVEFLVIRSISDSSDENANISFDEFLTQSAEVSAKFVLDLIKNIA